MPPKDHSLDPPYRLETERTADGPVVARVGGDLDYVGTPHLRRRLLDQVDAKIGLLIIDLTEVTLLSAAAMEMLLAVDVLAAARDCEVRIVAVGRVLLRPLSLTGLDERLRLYASLDRALRG